MSGNVVNKEFILIKSKNNKKLIWNENDGNYYILNELKNNVIEEKKFNNATYYSKVIFDKLVYEAIEFSPNLKFDIIENFFNITAEENSKLPKTIVEIQSIFKIIFKNFNQKFKRGIFAELICLLQDRELEPKNNIYTTYDMQDSNGNDIEIKSYSIVKKQIILSLKQLTTNRDAKIISVALDESSKNGETIYSLYKKLRLRSKERYSWIEDNIDEFSKDKYIVLENGIHYFYIRDIVEKIDLPKSIYDAQFTVDISLLKKHLYNNKN